MKKRLRFTYPIFRGLSNGIVRPLIYWIGSCVLVIILLGLFAVYGPLHLSWIQVIGAFIDSDLFSALEYKDPGISLEKKIFLTFIAILSLVFVSAVLIGMITNAFSNITYKFHNGDFRRSLKNYILIIGSGEGVPAILAQVAKQKRPIVIFAATNPNIDGYTYDFYRGEKTCVEDLKTLLIENTNAIYIVSDKTIINDDANCLTCLDILKTLSNTHTKPIHCYTMVNDFTTSEILCYSQKEVCESGPFFLVDIININEYIAEQLLLYSDFLPVIHTKDKQRVNIVILGAGNVARGMAYTLVHICHYPKQQNELRKTRITIMDTQAEQLRDTMVSSRKALFDLSVFTTINATGQRTEHHPSKDFLDIEWEFVSLSPESALGQQFLKDNQQRTDTLVRYIICPSDETLAMPFALHLPRTCYENPIAVAVNDAGAMAARANQTGMYGQWIPFSLTQHPGKDNLLVDRSEAGQKVNYFFEQAYLSSPSKTKEQAWYKLSESDKLSSIYCAMGIPLREHCFDQDIEAMAEAEHRRWMASVLLIGTFPADTKDKTHFLHPDIVPYDELSEAEKDKDKTLLMKMISQI